MAKVTVVAGILLIIVGLGGFMIAVNRAQAEAGASAQPGVEAPDAKAKKITAMIPAFVGLPIAVLGLVAMKPNLRMHAMHAAVMLGLIGFLLSAGRLIVAVATGKGSALGRASLGAMAAITLVYVILCVRSFIAARKARKLEAAA